MSAPSAVEILASTIDTLTRETADLRREVEGMREDAERYRWLRDSENVRVVLHCYNGHTETTLEWPSADAADLAIDACIAATRKGEQT